MRHIIPRATLYDWELEQMDVRPLLCGDLDKVVNMVQ